MIKISQLTEDTTPTSNDVVPVTDVETGVTKKVKLGLLYKALSLSDILSGDGGWSTYTPTVTGLTTAGTGQTYTYQSGLYKIIGKTCHFTLQVKLSSFGSASGLVQLLLPVTTANNGQKTYFSGYCCDQGVSTITGIKGTPYANANTNKISFEVLTETSNVQISDCNSNTFFRVSGTYEIA